MKLNLPNKLTLIRVLLIPLVIIAMILPDLLGCGEEDILTVILSAVSALLFIGAALTDMADGKIARKRNLITNFGKFLDPLADKLMVIGTMMTILFCARYAFIHKWLFWAVMIVIFREFTVTAVRLVAMSSGGVVIAANILGKIKTVTQIVCICSIIIEPLLAGIPFIREAIPFWYNVRPISWASMIVMTVFTLWSGINYIVGAWKIIDPSK